MRRVSMFAVLPAVIVAFVLLIRFRPRSVARFNRVVTNRITGLFAGRAPSFGILIHRGRKSGRVYRTPVNLFRAPAGFLIVLTYGHGSEWVKNVLADGGCELETRGRRYRLSNPEIVRDPSHRLFPWPARIILTLGGVTEYMRLSASPAASAAAAPAFSNGVVH
jgi:deazaflavin-dependent oxidoreductase (nitroreductase family)